MKSFILESIKDIITYNVPFTRILSCLENGFDDSDLQIIQRYLSGEKYKKSSYAVQVMFDMKKLIKLLDEHKSFLNENQLDFTKAKADLSTAAQYVNILTDVDSDSVSEDMVVAMYPRIKKILKTKKILAKDVENGENIDVYQNDYYGYFKNSDDNVNIVSRIPFDELGKIASTGVTSLAVTTSIALAGNKKEKGADKILHKDGNKQEPQVFKPSSGTIIPANLRISEEGIRFIQNLEKFSAKAYRDGKGYSIGYGVRIKNPNVPPISRQEADQMMRNVVKKFEIQLQKLIMVPLTQNQWDAIVSFAYNIGISAFRKSTFLKKLNAKDYNGASSEFSRWVSSNGKKLQGLVARREQEMKKFLA